MQAHKSQTKYKLESKDRKEGSERKKRGKTRMWKFEPRIAYMYVRYYAKTNIKRQAWMLYVANIAIFQIPSVDVCSKKVIPLFYFLAITSTNVRRF